MWDDSGKRIFKGCCFFIVFSLAREVDRFRGECNIITGIRFLGFLSLGSIKHSRAFLYFHVPWLGVSVRGAFSNLWEERKG